MSRSYRSFGVLLVVTAWVRKLYHSLRDCKAYPATDAASAMPQCFNWLVCASAASTVEKLIDFSEPIESE